MSVSVFDLSVPATRERVVLELDILDRGFHQVGGDLLALGDHLVHRLDHGRTADGQGTAAVGAHAEWDLRGVAMHHLDLVERHAELAHDKLGQRRFMTLAVAVGTGEHSHAAGGMDADFRHLIQPGARAQRSDHRRRCDAAGLQIGRNANAPQLAPRLGLGSASFEAVPAGVLQRRPSASSGSRRCHIAAPPGSDTGTRRPG